MPTLSVELPAGGGSSGLPPVEMDLILRGSKTHTPGVWHASSDRSEIPWTRKD
jgi:hypothetical protein